MSEENVEVAKRAITAINERDVDVLSVSLAAQFGP
jgi:hypothetical protein